MQSAIVIAIGWATGAAFPGGPAGAAALIGVSVLLALAMAGLSDAFALLARQREAVIGVSSILVLPLTFLSGAFLSLRLVPGWIADVARYNPVNWAASAGRAAVAAHIPWGTVGSYAGFLALAIAVAATAATLSFRAYLNARLDPLPAVTWPFRAISHHLAQAAPRRPAHGQRAADRLGPCLSRRSTPRSSRCCPW